MLIALLSDIHANYQALTAVVKHARACDPDVQFWCLGDVFGRGPDPFGVWYELTHIVRPRHWLVGNHEYYFAGLVENFVMPNGTLAGDISKRSDWEAIQKQQDIFRGLYRYDSIKSTVERMSVVISPFDGVYLTHGSFGKVRDRLTRGECVFEYLKSCADVARTFSTLRSFVVNPISDLQFITMTGKWTMPRLMIVGHTHQRALFWLKDGCRQENIQIGHWYDLPGDVEQSVLVNPGSVGFPREIRGDLCASYALLDWDERYPRISFHRVPYDRPATLKQLDEQQYPKEIKAYLSGKCSFAHTNNCPCAMEF